jgi:hypothetical protein
VRRALWSSLILITFALTAVGGRSIATASSSSEFELDGSILNVHGVPSWPIVAGDRISAKDSPVHLVLSDGSRLTLGPSSQAQIESSSINLLSGSLQFSFAADSKMRVLQQGRAVLGRAGSISTPSAPSLLIARPPAVRPPPISAR